MDRTSRHGRAVAATLVLGLVTVVTATPASGHGGHRESPVFARRGLSPNVLAAVRRGQAAPDPAGADILPTPKAKCGPGSKPETGTQGRVPKEEVTSGRAAQGYTCNAVQVSHVGKTGGYKVERYIDKAGRECAYYDTTLLFPLNAGNMSGGDLTGVAVLDMTDPKKPVKTATLSTPAMQSPHESVVLNQKRGLLAAVAANPVFLPGVVDIYDISADCRNPVLKASAPVGVLGHESGFAADGNTFYVASLSGRTVTAIDVSNPSLPRSLGTYDFNSHGINLSDDGNRLYMAANGAADTNSPKGLLILDTSEIQARKPSPQVKVVSKSTWALVSTPQNAIPVTMVGQRAVGERDEFRGGEDRVGAARIIDIADETKPRVVSNMRLEVNQGAAHKGVQATDYGTGSLQNYTGHYCNVPQRVDPGIVACTFILSGLRVFDIRDPLNPKEIAYFNGPIPKTGTTEAGGSAYAMSSPTFAPERGEIWYSDGNTGFYAVKLTNGVWPFPAASAAKKPATTKQSAAAKKGAVRTKPAPAGLPATGTSVPLAAVGIVLLGLALGLRRRSTRLTL